jgi:hypothetical protein
LRAHRAAELAEQQRQAEQHRAALAAHYAQQRAAQQQ